MGWELRDKNGQLRVANASTVYPSASMWGSAMALASGAWTIATLGTVRFQTVSGMADTTNNRIVLPSNGIYQVNFGATADVASMSAGALIQVALYINGSIAGSTTVSEITSGSTNSPGQGAGHALQLSLNDHLQVACYYNGTGTPNVYGRLDATKLDGPI